ncbi:hypothetical protein REPUB_Repub19eG0129900 [Reevesia pubescens]
MGRVIQDQLKDTGSVFKAHTHHRKSPACGSTCWGFATCHWFVNSCCSESQREAALLLGQFAATDSDCKIHIVQRGAVRPLIEMLHSLDVQLKEMSAFALGKLAQVAH